MNCKEKLLEVRDLHKVYTKEGVPTKALNGITFNVLNGEYLGIMGASGSGKTTLLNCIATVIKPTAGQMLYGEMEKKQRAGSKSGNWLSLVLGAVFLIFAYWIVLKHFMTAGNALIIVSVVFGIVGTVLSIRGLARLLSAAAASIKRKATSGLYIFTLRQLYENVVHKYISVSVASILIMLTIMLITDGSVSIMSYGKQITRGSSVYDFTVMGDERLVDEYLSNEKMNSYDELCRNHHWLFYNSWN